MSFLKQFIGTAAWLLASVANVQAQPAAPIVIKFSHVNPLNSPKNQAAEYFKKLAEEGTNGRVKVEIYPNSILYKDKEELEALQLGAVQMLAPTFGKFSGMGLRDFEVFDLPFLFDSFDQAHLVTQGPIGKALFAQLEAKGIQGLAYWDNGFKQMSANKPLLLPADFKGLKMRIFSSKVLDAEMRALGALPQVMAASEIYMSMQTGLVDGGENTESTFYHFKMYEVQSHLTLSSHGYIGYGVIANKKFWDGLPPDIRSVLDAAIAKATVFGNRVAKKENDDALEALRQQKRITIHTLSAAQRAEWKKVLLKSHDAVADRINKDTLKAIYAATGARK
jgi:C4-dicarboxylate-binding protein DctP